MHMLKHIIAILVLSALVVLFMPQTEMVVQALLTAHEWVANLLTNVFSSGEAGNIARSLIALLSIPLVAGLVPALVYWIVRKHWLPCFMEIMWVVWLVQAGALAIATKTVTL
jgi:hypothetical protein